MLLYLPSDPTPVSSTNVLPRLALAGALTAKNNSSTRAISFLRMRYVVTALKGFDDGFESQWRWIRRVQRFGK